MLAVRYRGHGDLEQLSFDEVEVPEPDRDEVLVEVRACGVNHVDVLTRKGQLPESGGIPHTPGSEVSGVVAATGPNVEAFQAGDRVVIYHNLSCGGCEFCRDRQDNVCLENGIFGVACEGGYAEYTVAPARNLLPLPENLGFVDAAALSIVGSTAWHMLIDQAELGIDETVLIVAGGSGIGSVGIQIAGRAGARVLASAGSERKRRLSRELGADATVDHSRENWSAEVRDLTGKRGVDVVFEHVGAATWDESVRCLVRNGRLVTCGAHTGFDVEMNLWPMIAKQLRLIGSFSSTRRNVRTVLEAAARGELEPVIHETLPLREAQEAQRMMEDRRIFGKIVLEP